MMGLRRVRSDVSTVRKEGVIRNGTDKVMLSFKSFNFGHLRLLLQAKVLEEASLIWAMVEMVGLASFYTYFVPKEGGEGVEMVVKPPRKDGMKAGAK